MNILKISSIMSVCLLSGCGFFTKPTPLVAFHYTLKPLDLSEYKNPELTVTNQSVCMPYGDYTSQIMLLNKLSNYIEYQRTIITDMNEYYNPSKK